MELRVRKNSLYWEMYAVLNANYNDSYGITLEICYERH